MFRQAVLCPDLDCGAGCPASLGAYLFAEPSLATYVLILYATQCLSRWGGGGGWRRGEGEGGGGGGGSFSFFILPELVSSVSSKSPD